MDTPGIAAFGLIMFFLGYTYRYFVVRGLKEDLEWANERVNAAWKAGTKERRWRDLYMRRWRRELGT